MQRYPEKLLRCSSVLVNTNVEGSGPVDRDPYSITGAPGGVTPPADPSIPEAGKSGSDTSDSSRLTVSFWDRNPAARRQSTRQGFYRNAFS
jgi:hypothetical protein